MHPTAIRHISHAIQISSINYWKVSQLKSIRSDKFNILSQLQEMNHVKLR